MKQLKVLSLFDGMSCGQLAISQLGFNYEYYASEIDKHAMSVTMSNFPDTTQLGSVEHWPLWSIDFADIDLIIGGSPCQGFSFAGKQLNFDDPRSKLFFVYVEILNYVRSLNPNVKFLLENVKMKKEYEAVISEQLGVQPVEINSNLVSAQNRKRLYWTNISGVAHPEDRGVYLKDILQEEVDEKYYLSDAAILRAIRKNYSQPKLNPDKTGALNTKNNSGQCSFDSGTTFISIAGKAKTQRSSTGRSYSKKHNYQYIKASRTLAKKDCQNKASCLTVGGHSGGNHSDMDLIIHSLSAQEAYTLNNLSGNIRRLTPIECERLQTVPDNYTAAASDTQRYRMLGNGWTVEVIKHILKNLEV